MYQALSLLIDGEGVMSEDLGYGWQSELLDLPAYLKRLGYADEDLAGGGSDRLIDEVIPHGSAEAIAEAVRGHLDAGADHVCLQPLGHGPAPVEDYRALAALLL